MGNIMDVLNRVMDSNIYIGAGIIFLSRILDVSMGTFRVQMIVRRKKLIAGVLGFFEVLIFILIVSKVIQNIGNWLNVIAYCGGFAVGNVVGIYISEKISKEIISVSIISQNKWKEIENRLRDEGFGVTRNVGYGKDGEVQVLRAICERTYFPKVREISLEYDRKAFITSYLITGKYGGRMNGIKSKL
ncbi:MAG: hypothetical protein A2163_08430 [Actinobacteria bacterium RBG_13_35_12]|uniref:DUF5698 domain-containing protein n=1 Tax=Candidatus Sediminicultor quintus TaxID=1797291 RepID=A0A1F5ADF5_9BACT|nr:MAG: hypothetical protein A2163_08430 [Actinobacteria bacterium RBG_13_35_12]OGD16386.1 MAG: hypothetical protein A2V47_02760 [Candidatus Atribacteria bacterium RBG_19FT_COMBO_35_14]OGD35006.1 MAG: hypothetical protein A2V94_08660 [Candidatus Atribacteria bacterium RBG_16_35_8]